MNRLPKYRAWYPKVQLFSYDVTINGDGTWTACFVDLNISIDGITEKDGAILMQYTDLKDGDDKEIYEGDLMQMPHDGHEPREITEVKWDHDTASFVLAKGDKKTWINMKSNSDSSQLIIGNIYQNADLLKKPHNTTI